MQVNNHTSNTLNKTKAQPTHMRKSSVPAVLSTVPSFSVAEPKFNNKYNSKPQDYQNQPNSEVNVDTIRDMISRKFEKTLEKHLEKLVKNQSNPNTSANTQEDQETGRFNDSGLDIKVSMEKKPTHTKVPSLDLRTAKLESSLNRSVENEAKPLSTVAEVSEKFSGHNSECSSQCGDSKNDSIHRKLEEERLESWRQVDDLKILKENIKELVTLVSQNNGIVPSPRKTTTKNSPPKAKKESPLKYLDINRQQEINQILRQRILNNLATDDESPKTTPQQTTPQQTNPQETSPQVTSPPLKQIDTSSSIVPDFMRDTYKDEEIAVKEFSSGEEFKPYSENKVNLNIKVNESEDFTEYNPFQNRLCSPGFITTPEKPSMGSDIEDISKIDSYNSGEKLPFKYYNPSAIEKYRKILFDSDPESSNNASFATGPTSKKGSKPSEKVNEAQFQSSKLEAQFGSSRLDDTFTNLITLIRSQNKGNFALDEQLTRLDEIHGLEILFYQQQVQNLNQRIKVEKDNQLNLIKSLHICEKEMDVLSSNNNSLSEIMLKYQNSILNREEEFNRELEKFKSQVDEEISTVRLNYENIIKNIREESKKEIHSCRQDYECKLIQKKREFAANEEKFKHMFEYTKNCEESIAAINLALRKLLVKAPSCKFASPTLYEVLSRIIEQTGKFVEKLDNKSATTEADSNEKESRETPLSSRRLNTSPPENLYDYYLSSHREELIKTAQTNEKRLRIDETVNLNPSLEKKINAIRSSPERAQNFYIVKVPPNFTHRRNKSESGIETKARLSDLSFNKPAAETNPNKFYYDLRRSSTPNQRFSDSRNRWK